MACCNMVAWHLQLEAKLAAAEGDKAAAIADSERQRLEATAAAAAARERSEAAEAELEELRSAMDRSIAAAREEALGAMDTVGELAALPGSYLYANTTAPSVHWAQR
jgi:hypothetical protein